MDINYIHIVEWTPASRRSSSMDLICRMATTQYGRTLFTSHHWSMSVCSTSTTINSGIILMQSTNKGTKPASVWAFGMELVRPLSWDPIFYLTGWLLNDIVLFLETVLPGLLKDVSLAVRQRLRFQHDGAPRHYGNMSSSGWTWHIQKGGFHVKDWLHGLFGDRI
jgi:hypothetical protein